MSADALQDQHEIFPVPDPVPSYWLSQPHKYSDLRSTASLPSTCDIAIIGSGMAGVLTAYHILNTTKSSSSSHHHPPHSPPPTIALLEARSLCTGATSRNGGHTKIKTATLLSLPPSVRTPFQAYVLDVITRLHHLMSSESLADTCEFELRRSFDVFCSSSEAKEMRDGYEEARRMGEAWTENVAWLDERIVQQVTSIRGAKGAFSVPAASFWPYRFVTGLVERMVERWPDRFNVQTNTMVTGVRVEEDAKEEEGGNVNVNVVMTDRGVLRAKKVVFATNAWTAGVVPAFKGKRGIVPVKGMASHHRIEEGRQIYPHLNCTYNIHFAEDGQGSPTGVDYLNPRPDGSIVVGGGSWFFKAERASWYANFDDSRRFPPPVEAHWHAYMQSNFLGWDDSNAKADYVWVGIMGNTSDGMPHVGRVPTKQERKSGVSGNGKGKEGGTERKRQQWILAGFNGGGMALIPTVAEAVARMVAEDKDFDDVEGEFELLKGFKTSWERLKEVGERSEMSARNLHAKE